jgi:hypothetical protein
LVAVVGSAVSAWWLAVQQRTRIASAASRDDRGTVIFDNTPRPADIDAVI